MFLVLTGRFFFTAWGLGSYNPALMSNRLPIEINPFRLIEQRKLLVGAISLPQLPRLRALVVAESEADFAVEMDFVHSLSGLPMIKGHVSGQVTLECQRCLEPVVVGIHTDLNVVVTESQTDREPEQEGYEICIVDNERLFLQDFIEDEILLALPVVPRHSDCQPVRPLRDAAFDEALEYSVSEGKKNPFDALKDWKKTE